VTLSESDEAIAPDPSVDLAVAGDVAILARPKMLGRALRGPATYIYGVVAAAIIIEFFVGSSYDLFLASTVVVYAIAAIGQDWLIGKAGQISIGGAAFLGVGSYTTAFTRHTPLHYFPVPIILSMVVGAFFGLIVAIPALRVSGLYLVLTTLAFQQIFAFWAQDYQGEKAGFYPPAMRLGGWNLAGSRASFLVVIVCLLLVILALGNLYRFAPGNIWRAIHEDPLATGVIGINVEKWRLLAFVGSSAVTALAGSLFAYLIGLVAYSTYTLTLGISLVVMVFLGGVGSPIGVLIGAAAITYLPVGLQHAANLAPQGSSLNNWLTSNQGTVETLVYGVVLVAILLFEPDGLAGIGRRIVRRLGRGRRHRQEVSPPATPAADSGDQLHVGGIEVEASVASVTRVRELSGEPLLAMTDVSVTYRNDAQGVQHVNLLVEPGSIVAIVGRNGAGKTSTLQAIAGFVPAERVRVRGSVKWKGEEIIRSSPRRTGRKGIVLVPERFKVFPSLTVREHFKADGIGASRMDECLEQFEGLKKIVTRKGGQLSGGERQLLGIALAVCREPQLLLVDELSLGLSPIATQEIIGQLKMVRDAQGISILLVDQAASAIAEVVDYYYLLEGGVVIGEGSSEDMSQTKIQAAVMGE
jgi:branched-chain amino acid transport system permease protein